MIEILYLDAAGVVDELGPESFGPRSLGLGSFEKQRLGRKSFDEGFVGSGAWGRAVPIYVWLRAGNNGPPRGEFRIRSVGDTLDKVNGDGLFPGALSSVAAGSYKATLPKANWAMTIGSNS